jgi:hypothetical protein
MGGERMSFREPEPRHEYLNNESSLLIYREFFSESKIYEKNNFSKEVLDFKEQFKSKNKLENLIRIEEISSYPLENNEILTGVDRFIDRIIQSTPRITPDFRTLTRRPIEPADRAIPQLPSRSAGRVFRSGTGLQVATGVSTVGLTVEGRHIVNAGNVARIDFTPGGRTYFEPRHITDSLVNGIQGLRELVRAVDEGQIDEVGTLVGTTNINMALIAQRLGFRIVDQNRTPDGEIDASIPNFTVVADMDEVRAKVREFEEEGRLARIRRRHQRQTSSHA